MTTTSGIRRTGGRRWKDRSNPENLLTSCVGTDAFVRPAIAASVPFREGERILLNVRDQHHKTACQLRLVSVLAGSLSRGRCQWVLDTAFQNGEGGLSHCGSTPPPSVGPLTKVVLTIMCASPTIKTLGKP